jgi:glycosyltransferase involved in cell wall biosynthesis
MFTLHVDTARSWRGGQNQALMTVLGLRARGHRTVLVAHPDGALATRAAEGHDLIRLAPANEVDFAAGFRFARILRELKPDIVHAHDPHGVSMAAMALSTMKAATRPLLVAARRVDFHLKRNAFSRWKYKQVDLMICSSDAIRQMVLHDGVPADRAVTVHEGIDVERVAAMAAADVHKELWLPTGTLVVGNVAALVPHKGQRYLVDAAPRVVRALPDTVFLIFGEGPLKTALQAQIHHLGLDQRVRLVGFRHDVLALLKSLDVFVLCSVTEGLGTSILDAMAASRPVVGTAAGGIPEAVEHDVTGLVVPPQRPAELGDAILALLKDPARRARMGEAGLARARAHFTADRMVEETLAAYAELAGKPRAAGNGNAQPPA